MTTTLNIGARVPQTEAEGPGLRYAVWTQGCPLRCVGCCNPHLLADRENQRVAVAALAEDILNTPDIEGLTFVGGEPFMQAPAAAVLAKRVREGGLSVMVFSGFTLDAIRRREDWAPFLAQIDLLVDGPYVQALHQTNRRWIGSSNQRIRFLTERYRHLKGQWDDGPNTIELRLRGEQMSINGFPHLDIEALARQSLRREEP
ncbi:MAG: 4Fe-4S single cluster domain-containing protein [Myxococcota bacterium]